MSYNVAVIGATGNVGRKVVDFLHSRKFPLNELRVFASSKSTGKKISFGDETLVIEAMSALNPEDFDLFFLCAGSAVSQEYAEKFAKFGVVIDKSSYFRQERDIPLIVPEVNIERLADYTNRNIICSPNCVAIPVSVALKPLHDAFGIKRIVVTSLQSVSGAGKEAMDELYNHTKARYVNDYKEPHVFKKDIVFNLIPCIGDIEENGYSSEENKICAEVKKLFEFDVPITVTSIRVPVFVGHSQAINVEFDSPVSVDEARNMLRTGQSTRLLDNRELQEFATPYEIACEDEVYISRIREDNSLNNALNLWVVSDNLTKGAALNAVQIAEILLAQYL
jgi:aspartate-semialdehyde dehydrogenase